MGSAAALLQNEMAAAGFNANLQQIPGSDFLTDVYIKKQGDAVLTEQLSNGPDLTNSFEALFESSGFVANALGSVNPQLTPQIVQANGSLSPSLQGPLMQQIDKTVIQQGLLVPLVFMFLFAQYAVGLVIYWSFSSVFTFVQQYVLMRRFKVDNPIDDFFARFTPHKAAG